jgi:hypothetical protein
MTGYVRQDTGNNIENGEVIDSQYLDQEFDAIQASQHNITGHSHGGATGEGAPITLIGPSQDFIASSTSLRPKTTNIYDLGTSLFEFKNGYFEGAVAAGSFVGTTNNSFQALNTDTAAAPGFTWDNDLNTGMFRPATDTIAWSTGGTERMRISSAGLVTIADSLTVTNDLIVTDDVTIGGTLTATLTGSITGNSATATALQTARTIGLSGAATGTATSFNGTANITIPVTGLNASNLDAGTIPNARVSGDYNGLGNLTGSGIVNFNEYHGATGGSSDPSFTFATDDDTGMFLGGTNTLSFSTGGSTRLTITGAAITATGGAIFTGDGSGLTSIGATNLTGTIANARISGSYTGFTNITASGVVTSNEFAGDDGGASDPTFTFSGGDTTGIYRTGSGFLGFSTGGTERATLGSSGFTLATGVFSGDGSSLTTLNATNISSGTLNSARMSTTRDWVLSRLSETSGEGVLGSYAFLSRETSAAIAPGEIISGANLDWAVVGDDGSGAANIRISTATVSGSWMAMGGCVTGDGGGGDRNATLFLRVG